MKNVFMISGPLLVIGIILLVIGFIMPNDSKSELTQADKSEENLCCKNVQTKGEISETSIYQSDIKWTDENNNTVQLKSYKGQPVVLTMFFASCTYACPMLVNDMKKIEASIPKDKLSKFRFVLVSIDPDKDTPEKLKKYASDKQLDLNRWTLLTGKNEDVQELAAMIGFKYKKEPEGGFSHSNLITILNNEGEIANQQIGLNSDPSVTLNEIKNL